MMQTQIDTIEISYGKGKIALCIPKNRYKLITSVNLKGVEGSENIKNSLAKSLEKAIGTQPLERLIANKRVTYLIEDSTRAEPHQEMLDATFLKLKRAAFVNAVISTGSHKTYSEGNKKIIALIKRAAEMNNVKNYEIIVNDAFDKNSFMSIGKTPAGTTLEINKKALDCDVFLVNADMKTHYFAGYSNAIKDFLPGICSYNTIEMNHSMALDPRSTFGRHPFHPDPLKRDNPLAKDMYDALYLIKNYQKNREIFVLSVITFDDKLIWSAAGDIEQVTQMGIQKLDQISTFTVKPSKYLIISPGGYPEDLSLYNAQRGLEMSKNAVNQKGEILFLAECEEGIAPNKEAEKHFYQRLTADLDDVLKSIKEKYILYSHKAYKFAELLKNTKSIYMYTNLNQKEVESVHMKKIEDPQKIVNKWLNELNEIINIVDNANKIAVYS